MMLLTMLHALFEPEVNNCLRESGFNQVNFLAL